MPRGWILLHSTVFICLALYFTLPVYAPLYMSICLSSSIFFFLILLNIYASSSTVFLSVSPCRLSVQTVSHEPLLGPEAVLESGEAWREHGHGAPQQAPCKWSDDMFSHHRPAHYTQTCPRPGQSRRVKLFQKFWCLTSTWDVRFVGNCTVNV